MYEKRCLARLAAASSATVLMTVGAFIPAYAGNDDAQGAQAAQSGGSHGAEVSAEARADAAVAAHSRASQSTDTQTSGPGGASVTTGPDHSQGNASTTGSYNQPQPESNADQNSGGANAGSCAAGTAGSYCSTRDGSASLNGQGGGKATGKPCAGCVGKADNKNPPGQYPDGSDHNAGYECDRNQGIGKTNPAHTGCKKQPPPYVPPKHEEKPPAVVPEVKPKPPAVVPEVKPKPPAVVPEVKPKPPAVVPAEEVKPPAAAPVEEVVPAAVPAPPEVAGVEAAAPAPAVAPAAGVLPPTGAEDYTLPILGGLVFLTAGGALVARRRLRTDG